MKRLLALSMILVATLAVSACGDDDNPTNPSDQNTVRFTANLLPSNETSAVVGGEANATGSATMTFHLTRDAAQQITGATIDFSVTLNNLPNGTVVSAAHIHPGAAGVSGGILISTGLTSGEVVAPASGSVTFTKNGVSTTGENATNIVNNPSQFYFNVHSPTNGGGFARGQLVKQ
ncbi:MAG TPA: CHRD domain-containing protein [Vicinamibacterales bacterium]|nr:CHRD domain-containing protein [Vicinamibacterales bacterium]